MLRDFIEMMREAMRIHPVLAVLVFSVSCLLFLYSQDTFAGKSEFQKLSKRVDGLACKIETNALDVEIRRLQSDLYYVGRVTDRDDATERDHEWFSKLNIDLGEKKRDLAQVMKECGDGDLGGN